ncbi:hypothetical protein [Tritonibacter mobilis]|uniref:hypothetical protein n=1 Tax=Tritonibacter mobilis TaxID=379347 RepID=UPI0013A65EF3|nr:hypothetical protein [Tritonibacter mobilis]
MSVQKLSNLSGVSTSQIHKIKSRENSSTNVEDASRIAGAFGKTVNEFLDNPELKVDIEIAQIVSELTPEERRFLLNAAKAQIASRSKPQD